jgi:hypothetical protein
VSPQNAAIHILTDRAKALWDLREQRFPKFCRLSWESGTLAAKDPVATEAFDQLTAEGVIIMTTNGPVPSETGITPEMRALMGREGR